MTWETAPPPVPAARPSVRSRPPPPGEGCSCPLGHRRMPTGPRRRPDREETVVPSERDLGPGTAIEVEHPEVDTSYVVYVSVGDSKHQSATVGRNAWIVIQLRLEADRLFPTVPIDEHESARNQWRRRPLAHRGACRRLRAAYQRKFRGHARRPKSGIAEPVSSRSAASKGWAKTAPSART